MTVFVIIGAAGLALVAVSLIFGDVLDGMFDFAHFDVTDGWISTPVLGAFLAAFGFVGALLAGRPALPVPVAAGGGLAAGVVLAALTAGLVRTLMNMPTDPTLRTRDLVGSIGTVVTRIPDGGLGEIVVTAAGQRMKLSARAERPLPAGTTVVVVEVASPTSVIVTESGF